MERFRSKVSSRHHRLLASVARGLWIGLSRAQSSVLLNISCIVDSIMPMQSHPHYHEEEGGVFFEACM